MMTFLLVLLLGVCQRALSQSQPHMCDGAVFVDGTGYKQHEDCDKFIECGVDQQGQVFGWVKQCSFGTYWDMDHLTCEAVDKAICPKDKCEAMRDGDIYPTLNNCRGYWRCKGGKSQPECCPMGKKFIHDLMMCVDDTSKECSSTCITHIFHVPENCDKFEVPGKPTYYSQIVEGWGAIELPCAPGTGFDPVSCNCIRLVNVVPTEKVCRPELYLPFNVDHRDASGKNNYVSNENVIIANGKALFNGKTSRLLIPRFTNFEQTSTIVIKVKYASNHSEITGMAHAILGNNGCQNIPTLLIAEDFANAYIGVSTDITVFAFAPIPQSNGVSKELMYKLSNQTLSGKLRVENGLFQEGTTNAPGSFKNAKCALQVGYADSMFPFKGEVDELSIYLCDPDN
ncbi:hypothetical protein DPMN_059843 [Dreissena polymorpha]|nr:hypothetical protein DPMN_059843 [Dreissena polymorpha]